MAPKKTDNAETVYEVVHGTVAFSAADIRKVGDEIRASEINDGLMKILLDDGTIRDTSAPLSPAQVGEKVVDVMIDLAQRLGLVTNEGSKYSFAGNDYKGLEALRSAASPGTVSAAIVAAFAGKQIAITELTAQLAAK
jgi:hypothetical protein